MPLSDEQRRTVLSALSRTRRLLRSDDPMDPEVRESIAALLEEFEAAVLVLDAAERQMRATYDRHGKHS